MVSADGVRLLLPEQVRRFPPDLAFTLGLVVAGVLVATLPVLRGSPLRVALGIPLVLFAPGYAVVAALIPESHDRDESEVEADRFLARPLDGVTVPERFVFSVGLSFVTVPLLGLLVNFSPWAIGQQSLFVAISGFTFAMVGVATVRRWQTPPERRFSLPVGEWYASARSELLEPVSRTDAILNVVLVAAVLIGVAGGAYALLGPQDDQTFTELYLLAENESGDLVADDYPQTIRPGQRQTVVVGIGNNEGQQTTYTVVVELQRLQNDSGTVLDAEQVARFRRQVDANETVRIRHEVEPELTGTGLRLQYLLYEGDPPANPTAENAYRSVHIWVNATNRR